MEIKISESELQFLVATYGKEDVKLEFTGINQFTIFHPKASIPCEIVSITSRSIRIQYQLGFFKNLALNWFVKLENEGIFWNKPAKQIDIDPFSFLPEKEKKVTEQFRIKEFRIEEEELVIRLGILT